MNDHGTVWKLSSEGSVAVPLPEALTYPDDVEYWVRAVFVASLDGAATVSGHAGGLGNDTDKQLFSLNRALADVIVVGAGTARIEGYGPAQQDPQWASLRQGRGSTAPMAVVTASMDLDLDSKLIAGAPEHARTIIITTAEADAQKKDAAVRFSDVIIAGDTAVDPAIAVRQLRKRGFNRISCEGGPTLLADFVRAEALDELCLTRSPQLVAGHGARILNGEAFNEPIGLELTSLHSTDDGYLYMLYRQNREA